VRGFRRFLLELVGISSVQAAATVTSPTGAATPSAAAAAAPKETAAPTAAAVATPKAAAEETTAAAPEAEAAAASSAAGGPDADSTPLSPSKAEAEQLRGIRRFLLELPVDRAERYNIPWVLAERFRLFGTEFADKPEEKKDSDSK
jgi:hypothetical protein